MSQGQMRGAVLTGLGVPQDQWGSTRNEHSP